MIPVFGRITHDPVNDAMGDCFRACVASVLELPYEDVPHFMEKRGGGYNQDWLIKFRAWLLERGLEPVFIDPLDCPDPRSATTFWGYGYVIASGWSPRHPGVMHSVVHYDTQMVHDPVEGGEGLRAVTDYLIFVPINPAVALRAAMAQQAGKADA